MPANAANRSHFQAGAEKKQGFSTNPGAVRKV